MMVRFEENEYFLIAMFQKENRQIRFRPYSMLQEKGIQIQYKDYTQVYLARM